ncbi:RNA polymerase sigma factor [Mucilaginibacter auburnensis]|uniref:RNA polymerase sigma-70 factor (ECF subfamily) n=1 Tax=Mucilaginibacter auburnensis TaxID=1457233 RepID=A0A2H9VQM9_9SPHI|nr:sigma-70 family RNA polymerase sigma factor [Mucilaginibacter auburnensis]PJJ83129.1 RNA polymerase sigma-70 factor (ECF subfamily) [Mucilaginibacter auburnensis]
MGDEELHRLIRGCIDQDRRSQKQLYKAFYGFAMSICLRYTANRYEASEVMNMAFYKVLTNINAYDGNRSFKAWLGRILTNTAIDYYRSNLKTAYTEDLETAEHISDDAVPYNNLGYNDLLAMVQQLPQSYRTVFNLFAIDGYSHDEIAEMLSISEGTSKSNLFKARQKLKQMILAADAAVYNYKSGADYQTVAAVDRAVVIRKMFTM